MIGIASDIWRGLSLRIKIVSTAAGAIGTVAGMIVAVPPAWTAVGLPEVATRGWVQHDVHDPMKVAQAQTQRQVIDLQIDVANGKIDQLDNARATLEIEKLKAADDAIKARADVQIRKIERDTAAIADQIRTLRSLRGQP